VPGAARPLRLLTALLSPARYVEAGAVRTAARPWEVLRNHLVDGEDFEVYPNRDSTGFVEQYGVHPRHAAPARVEAGLDPAMARLVSRPVALGVRRILVGDLPPGLHRGTENATGARAWLDDLARDGIPLCRDGAGLAGAGPAVDRA